MSTQHHQTKSAISDMEETHVHGSIILQPLASFPPTTPYSIYTHREKWLLVGLVVVAGLFSPLPANIYFPAIPKLAVIFEKSIEGIELTVTIYLAIQGCSPMFWGPLSD